MSSVSLGYSTSLSLDFGEKQVRTWFISALNPGIVVLPSTAPVMRAVLSPSCVFAMPLTCSYRYSAVSEKAVKIRTFLLPGLIGFSTFSRITRSSSLSL